MNHDTTRTMEMGERNADDSSNAWVRDVLEPDQLTASKMHYGRRKLSLGTLILLWALRGYVVFMVVIVGLAVWNALHAGV